MSNKRGRIVITAELFEELLDLPGRILQIKLDHETDKVVMIVDEGFASEGKVATDLTDEWASKQGPDDPDDSMCPKCGEYLYVNKITITNDENDCIYVFCRKCGYSILLNRYSLRKLND